MLLFDVPQPQISLGDERKLLRYVEEKDELS